MGKENFKKKVQHHSYVMNRVKFFSPDYSSVACLEFANTDSSISLKIKIEVHRDNSDCRC